MPEFPAMLEIVPQAGAMVLLSRVLHHEETRTVCSVEIEEQTLFRDASGEVPAWIGLEYMAQCIAAHSGLVGRAAGIPPRLGFLLGSRRVSFYAPCYRRGQTLRATARRVWGKTSGMVSWDCSLEDADTGELLAEGRLNCFLPEGNGDFGDFP